MKRGNDFVYDEDELISTTEKKKYVKPEDYSNNVSFSFIHVAWASIASLFRALYKITEEDLIRISNTNFQDTNAIIQAVQDTHGIVVSTIDKLINLLFFLYINFAFQIINFYIYIILSIISSLLLFLHCF